MLYLGIYSFIEFPRTYFPNLIPLPTLPLAEILRKQTGDLYYISTLICGYLVQTSSFRQDMWIFESRWILQAIWIFFKHLLSALLLGDETATLTCVTLIYNPVRYTITYMPLLWAYCMRLLRQAYPGILGCISPFV